MVIRSFVVAGYFLMAMAAGALAGDVESRGPAEALRAAVHAYEPQTAVSARRAATDAFFLFEGSELDRELAARVPELYRSIEGEWRKLLTEMDQGASVNSVRESGERVLSLLESGERSTAAEGGVFLDSLLIILREGFEAILIISALAAYLARVGQRDKVPILFAGGALAVAASVGLWFATRTVIEVSGFGQEALEGGAMLVAALVLFWTSYWLVSKAEAERWQAFVRSRAEAALGRGALLGFGALSFVVVFREGFETVLFYEAVAVRAGGSYGQSMLAGGFLSGFGLLIMAYVLFLRFGRKIPLTSFFNVTGALFYFMAIKFAGAGVYELQVADLVSQTPIGFLPDSEALRQWLALYPYAEPLALQTILVILVFLAIAVAWRSRWSLALTAFGSSVKTARNARIRQ